jgi:hypothetical protein
MLRALTLAALASLAALPAAAQDLSPGQLDAATRVYTGKAACDAGQSVDLAAVPGRPGHFTLQHKKAKYALVPEETTTGAVRLEDKKAGIVWIQIPSKSMLMNSKIGQRVADGCKHPQQS